MKIALYVLAALFLLTIGAVGGYSRASSNYQPRLDEASTSLASITSARDNLLALTTEQGLKLGELVRLGNERALAAEKAQAGARAVAANHYAAANEILRGRTDGDQCVAAEAVIDGELFGQ